ncbi:hypothetical protein T484DRAFT_1820247, partial [Baffinella frigidus]
MTNPSVGISSKRSDDESQSQRESTIKKFKEGSVTVVIATDVAARGLDIKGGLSVTVVIATDVAARELDTKGKG